jgi:hypothetical protein
LACVSMDPAPTETLFESPLSKPFDTVGALKCRLVGFFDAN